MAHVLSNENQLLLKTIMERKPEPLKELEAATGRSSSNLSRTWNTMAVLRAEFEENMNSKLRNRSFLGDIPPLLPTVVSHNVAEAGPLVGQRLIAKLHGDPWRGADGAGI